MWKVTVSKDYTHKLLALIYQFDPADYVQDRKWIWLVLACAVLVLDQVTKWLVVANMGLFDSIEVMAVLNITRVHNEGAAFSFLAGAGGWQRWFFVLLALVVSGFVLTWMGQAYYWQRGLLLSLSLVLGGALGNALDRLIYGYVIDFVDVHYSGWHWPTFNVADAAIVTGAVLFVFVTLRKMDRE